jgi:hypothetical protein
MLGDSQVRGRVGSLNREAPTPRKGASLPWSWGRWGVEYP